MQKDWERKRKGGKSSGQVSRSSGIMRKTDILNNGSRRKTDGKI